MEQWTEPTSLRLLELIASTAMAPTAHSDAHPSGGSADTEATEAKSAGSGDGAVVRALVSLAESDPHFRDWLRARLRNSITSTIGPQRLPVAHTAESDRATFNEPERSAAPAGELFSCALERHQISENWLAWLAAESSVDAVPERGSIGSDDDASDRVRTCEPRYRRVLIASAQAALRSRALAAECEKTRGEIARELAYDMAYGLSHELNNPLANIAARARLLAEDESSEHKRLLLAAIVDQAMRGCEMIADLMLVARPPVLKLEPVDVGLVVRETIVKARPWAEARGLNLTVVTRDQALIVSSERSALAEALWTLLRNAIEVARQEITLTVSSATSASTSLLQSGDRGVVTLSVQDDGPGISPQAQARAFHPYFSGREAGRGLGVGLAKADRIASLSGGSVTISNAAGGGCAANISLPLRSE